MSKFTLSQLSKIYQACEGVDIELSDKNLDESFIDLGMDSLGIMELAERIEREYQVPVPSTLPGETADILSTPRKVITYVNQHLDVD